MTLSQILTCEIKFIYVAIQVLDATKRIIVNLLWELKQNTYYYR